MIKTIIRKSFNLYLVLQGSIQQKTALTCLTENLWGYICGCATYGEDWFSHNHGKTKVSQLQPADASSLTLYLRENMKNKIQTDTESGLEAELRLYF